ncbi:MAG: HEAT repeat domain-containing protein [Acidobacteria bacterium]|nr:HEAT repeat domain-containing protein [Acidobacteriota bacterium]
MRLRVERRIRKQLRRKENADLAHNVRTSERAGLSLDAAITQAALHTQYHRDRGARLMGPRGLPFLLERFTQAQDLGELFELARAIEYLRDPRAITPLIAALQSGHPGHAQAAAYALGWLRPTVRSTQALITALADPTQPEMVRQQAAESLAYHDSTRAIPALISELANPAVSIRFFAVFAFGSIARFRPRQWEAVRRALEPLLDDHAVLQGMWSVSLETLAMLGPLDARYAEQLAAELRRIEADPNASKENRDWFGFYSH